MDREFGIWLFTFSMFRAMFPNESESSRKAQLRSLSRRSYLLRVCRNLYANDYARSRPGAPLKALVPYLRPRSLNYLSRESRLSELGSISQIPIDYLTVMTTGRSAIYRTAYGMIEFSHTARPMSKILAGTSQEGSGLLVACEDLAVADLRRARRNLHMISDAGIAP